MLVTQNIPGICMRETDPTLSRFGTDPIQVWLLTFEARPHGPVAQWNESATLRRSRSHVQIVPGPPICYGVAELERRESLKLVYVGSNPTSVAKDIPA